MNRTAFFRLMSIGLLVLVAGCSSFSTSNRGVRGGRVTGQLYYLPKGKIRITGDWKNPSSQPHSLFIVSIAEEIEADPFARFYLKPEVNVFYDDVSQITVNAKGLLTTADASAEDKLPAIIATATTAGVSGLEFGAAGGPAGLTMQAVPKSGRFEYKFKPFSFVFDPSDTREREAIIRRVAECGFTLRVTPQEVRGVPLVRPRWAADADVFQQGVVFRPLRPWRVTIDSDDDSIVAMRESKLVHLPDEAHPLILDYTRLPFVRKETSVTFVDGTLRDYSQKRPSVVLGLLGVPKALLGAIAPLPIELKQTQITNLRAEETLRNLRRPSAE